MGINKGQPRQFSGVNWTTLCGVAGVPLTTSDATSGLTITGVPAAGQFAHLTDLIIGTTDAVKLTLKTVEDVPVAVAGYFDLPANTLINLVTLSPLPAHDGKALQLVAEAAGAFSVTPLYHYEDVAG